MPYILVRGTATIARNTAALVAFKDYAPFSNCNTKIDGTTINDSEDLEFVMPMYNLLEYSSNCSLQNRQFIVLFERQSN